MAGGIAISTYTGTGSAINVAIGFVPDYVRIINITDSDVTAEWFAGMTDGIAVDTAAAVAANADNGISKLESTSLGFGFIVGTDYSESAKVYRYIALKATQ